MNKLNLLLLIIIGFMITSCSSEDGDINMNTEPDPIVGTWQLLNRNYCSGLSCTETAGIPAGCFQENRETFSENGNYSLTNHLMVASGDCTNIIQAVDGGKWKLQSNGKYKITGTVKYSTGETYNLNIEFSETSFTNNETNMRVRAIVTGFDVDGSINSSNLDRIFDYRKLK